MRGVFLLLMVCLTGCGKKDEVTLIPQRLEIQQPLMGTLFQVTCYAIDLPTAQKVIEEGFEKAQQLEKVATNYDPTSELNQLCAKPAQTAVPVSDLLFNLLQLAYETAEQTDGSYDPTLGPLTHLWRETRRLGVLPSAARLQEAQAACGYQFMKLDQKQQTVTLMKNGMQLDLGGIAKGYAADIIFTHLQEHGLSQSLVAAGGDLRLGEAPPEKDGWTVGMQTFHLTPSSTKSLVNCAVSTSGDLHQRVVIADTSYAHLIDPKTGLGLTTSKAVTVIAPLARLADPLATAACLHPEPEKLLNRFPELSFRILTTNRNLSPLKSGAFKN